MAWFKILSLFTPVIKAVDPWLREHGFNKLSVADRLGVHKFLFGVGDSPSTSIPAAADNLAVPRDVTARASIDPCAIIYGEIEASGSIVFQGVGGTGNKYLFFVVEVAHHQCEAITEFRLDNTRIRPSQWDAGVTNMVSHPQFIGSDGLSKLKITVHLGTNAQTVDSELQSTFPEWDSTHKGKGVAYYVVRCENDNKAFPAGAPNDFFAIVKGRRVYDARKDSTNGGSGSHRANDATTWEWSDNTALCARDYLTGGSICYDVSTPNKLLTLGESDARMDDPFVIAAANHCDESCTVPIPVLPGLTGWTNSSNTVTGIGTEFTRLSGANYLRGPDNNFYQVSSVGSDTSLSLTSSYTGTTTANAITQYHTSATTTTTQKRFTCNIALSLASTHSDCLQDILSSMIGRLAYTGGRFRMFAGVYDAPTVTLNEDDFIGPIEVQTHPLGEDVYNLVQGTFFDEDRNWQEMPFPAQTQSSYQTDDGGTFPKNIRLPATRTSFRCQRMANVILNQSRNKTTVKFTQLSEKAILIGPWETFNVNISEYTWINQLFRCVDWELLPNGFVAINAQIESSSAYADPASTDYQLPRNSNPDGQKVSLPSAPTGLSAVSQPGAIAFFVSGVFANGTIIELWEHTSSSPFSSATKIAEGIQTTFVINKGDMTQRFYWVRSRLNGQVSSTFPASTGTGALAGLSSFVARGNCVVSGNSAQKVGGTTGYDSDVYSINAYTTCHLEFKMNAFGEAIMVGLNTDPTTDQTYTSLDYAWQQDLGGNLDVYTSGSPGGLSIDPFSTSDVFGITYDGSTVNFIRNGVVVTTRSISNKTFFMDSSFYTPGAGINSLDFGPTTKFRVTDTPQIGDGAVSPAPVSSSPSDGTQSYASTTQPAIESSGINATASITPDIELGTSRIDVTWSAQAKIDVTTSGGAVGTSIITATIQVNGSTVFSKEYSIEGTASIGDYVTVAGATNISVPAGQTLDAFLNSGRHFTTSGSSPAQVHSWKSAHLALQAAKR